MTDELKKMVLGILKENSGNKEAAAQWMRKNLRIRVEVCRTLIAKVVG